MNEEMLIVSAIMGCALLLVAFCFGSARIMHRCPPMLPLPVQSLFTYLTLFTLGIALLSTRASLLVPFGLVFTFVGIAIFLPEQIAARCIGVFFFLLAMALLSLLQQLRTSPPVIQARQLTVFSAGAFVLLWGFGVLLAWRRWLAGRAPQSD